MNKIISIAFGILSTTMYSQSSSTDLELIRIKSDSILKESRLLYRLEKAAWISTDIAFQKSELIETVGGMVSYIDEDQVISLYCDQNNEYVLAEYIFKNVNESPIKESYLKRKLSSKEQNILAAKNKFIDQISTTDYELMIYDGFSPNITQLESESGYKFYITTGAQENDVIPFGNDVLFWTDVTGKILTHQKFHKSFIPGYTKYNDSIITSMSHSHVKDYPYISATDISTFRLYAPFSVVKSFNVLSGALGVEFQYHLDTDEITLRKL